MPFVASSRTADALERATMLTATSPIRLPKASCALLFNDFALSPLVPLRS